MLVSVSMCALAHADESDVASSNNHDTQETASSPRVAHFIADITPKEGELVSYYQRYDKLETVEHPLYAKGIVIKNGQQRYVLCALDYAELRNSTHTLFRQKIAEAVETDVAQVAVQTVHQHTAPFGDYESLIQLVDFDPSKLQIDFQTLDKISSKIAAAAREAVDRLQPFDRIGTSYAKVDRVASTRRNMVNGTATLCGMVQLNPANPIARAPCTAAAKSAGSTSMVRYRHCNP